MAVFGLGGAAFSSAEKIARVSEHEQHQLIINAVECEPGIECDNALLQQHADEVIEACRALCTWLNIAHAQIAIENDKPAAILALQGALQAHRTTEAPLIYRLLGIDVANQQHAADHGVLCLNVATVLAIYQALQGRPAIQRIVSVSTVDLKHVVNLQVRFGTPICKVIAFAQSQHQSINDAASSETNGGEKNFYCQSYCVYSLRGMRHGLSGKFIATGIVCRSLYRTAWHSRTLRD